MEVLTYIAGALFAITALVSATLGSLHYRSPSIWTGCIALCCIGLAGACWLQDREWKKDAANQATNKMGFDQRPWITIESARLEKRVVIGEKPRVRITFVNTGRTPATDLSMSGQVVIETQDTQWPKYLHRLIGVKASPVSRMALGINKTSTGAIEAVFPLTDQVVVDAYNAGTMFLFVSGVISYSDVSNGSYGTTFCYYTNGARVDVSNMVAWRDGNSMK